MKDGGYCLGINDNDSSRAGNAVIMKLGSTGNILWSKVLDKGGDDGVNSIAEYNDTLLVAGYATGDGRDAIVTKLYKTDGSFISAKMFSNRSGYHDEALSIEVSGNIISFSVSLYSIVYESTYHPLSLTHFKMNKAGAVTYQRKADVTTNTGYNIETIQSRATDDNGFIYLANDTTPSGYSTCVKAGPYGMLEWGRNFYDYGYRGRTTGMDITGDHGYVFAGFKNDYFVTSMKNKIQVFKTDRVGQTGKCPLDLALDFIDTSNYKISPFTWASIETLTVQDQANEMSVDLRNFSVIHSCEQLLCETVQTVQDGCNTNFMAEYKSELNISAADVAKLADGTYALAGKYSYYWNVEPSIIKTKPNGDVAWAKTYNDYIHDGEFIKVLPAPGNTMLLVGNDSYTIDHGISDSAILMKIDYSGSVIWAKKYARNGAAFSDVQVTDDGGCVVTINENYGSGSGQSQIVARIDVNGNFVWKKQVNALNLVVRNLLYDKTGVYVCGNAYINYASVASVLIFKLDPVSGDLIWQKELRSTAAESIYPIDVEKIGDSLIAAVHIFTPISEFESKRDAGFIKLNPADGGTYGAFRIDNINHLTPELIAYYGQTNSVWAAKSGNDMIFANAGSVDKDTSIYISRVSTSGKLIWSKKYSDLKKHRVTSLRHVNDGFVLAGQRFDGTFRDYNVYQQNPFILKTGEDGNIGNAPSSPTCINTNYAAMITAFSVTGVQGNPQITSVENLPEGSYYGYLGAKEYRPYVRDVKKQSQIFCSTASNCNSIKIVGPDSICNLQDTLLYKLEKNAGCTAAALWETDTAYASVITSTDSTIYLKYTKTGTVLIKATITSGCTGLTAERNIKIIRQANSLYLGPDTILCANNSYTLRGGTGFKSYSWSPGSSSDSVNSVAMPGIYKLAVTDFCNNSFTDSVIISPANFVFSVGKDTMKCNADSVVLTATTGFVNYTWKPTYRIQNISAEKVSVFPSIDTSYIVQAEKWAGCFVRDTIHIAVKTSPAIALGRDTSICTGEKLTLDASNPSFTSYRWNNGSVLSQTLVNVAGIYSVNATTAQGCQSSDTIRIASLPLPVVSLNHDTGLCTGSTRTLNAGNYTSYYWQDGSGNKTFTAKGTGIYYVQVTDVNGCRGSDTTRISRLFSLPSAFLPGDTSVCSYGSISIGSNQSFESYRWNTNETNRIIQISKPGLYSLEVKDDNNCIGSDSIAVRLKECTTGLYVPSAFTPNYDNKNDKLRALLFGDIKSFEFRIYNRFGQLVFQTGNVSEGWDGKINGVEQSLGTYVWTCRYQLGNESAKTEKGTTVLVR